MWNSTSLAYYSTDNYWIIKQAAEVFKTKETQNNPVSRPTNSAVVASTSVIRSNTASANSVPPSTVNNAGNNNQNRAVVEASNNHTGPYAGQQAPETRVRKRNTKAQNITYEEAQAVHKVYNYIEITSCGFC